MKCSEKAVSYNSGFLYGAKVEEMASVKSRFCANWSNEKKVPSKSIAYISQQNFDVMKINIKGAEWRGVFKNIIEEDLITQTNYWFVQFHEIKKNIRLFEEILNCLKVHGFKSEERKEVFYFIIIFRRQKE